MISERTLKNWRRQSLNPTIAANKALKELCPENHISKEGE